MFPAQFCYNVQPNVDIDYSNGDNKLSENAVTTTTTTTITTIITTTTTIINEPPYEYDYVGNLNTHVFHYPSCSAVKRMSDKNKYYFIGTRSEIKDEGYDPCQICNP